jgi:hypothetical protein
MCMCKYGEPGESINGNEKETAAPRFGLMLRAGEGSCWVKSAFEHQRRHNMSRSTTVLIAPTNLSRRHVMWK